MVKRRNLKRTAKKASISPETESGPQRIDNLAGSTTSKQIASHTNQSVLLKICRLCESKDGPFLDIFDAERIIAKKIYDIMPFVIAENDNLPQKICFRCSAKVEELHEFIQKCLNAQKTLCKAMGMENTITVKPRRDEVIWEKKLNECNISNDDICKALVKKAIEGIPTLTLKDDEPILFKKQVGSDSKLLNEKSYEVEDMLIAKEQKQKSNLSTQTHEENEKTSSSDDEDVPLQETSKESQKKLEKVGPENKIIKTNMFSVDSSSKSEDTTKPFNIMDHVSMIKVNGVGVLFQCKLCNRNFLKKDVVISHGCAKNGGKKIAEEIKTAPPPPPKIPLIKYINTKTQNVLPIQTDTKPQEKHVLNNTPINIDDDDDTPLKPQKKKPKIGPASKVGKPLNITSTPQPITSSPSQSTCPPLGGVPSVQLPFGSAHLNSLYKLVPGPNNSFMLVEDKSESPTTSESTTSALYERLVNSGSNMAKNVLNNVSTKQPKQLPKATEKPYPVGLFKSGVSQQSTSILPTVEALAMPPTKKQSYTIVKTGNPSKLVISTKPQANENEVPQKKARRSSRNCPGDSRLTENENEGQNSFFTFVNVDPIAQPSYVLPTDNIIQESQISTSTSKAAEAKDNDTYSCNMCDEKFSREKKLLTHIQSHYSKMDEEDEIRAHNNSKKRKSKS
ncbi:unnamed protein product [Leptosia nina]|uniref:ZAD domain-containing protein n=1 Tax=Leptosia nina TaxID=320188 RepID=A0AAV1JCK5_9NEOP